RICLYYGKLGNVNDSMGVMRELIADSDTEQSYVLRRKPLSCFIPLFESRWMTDNVALSIYTEKAERFMLRYADTSKKSFCCSIATLCTRLGLHAADKKKQTLSSMKL
ncbi:MAG: hypothetical protein AB7Y74_07980, partial [Syntrophorhabdus sp.]